MNEVRMRLYRAIVPAVSVLLASCSLGGPEPSSISLSLEIDKEILAIGETMQITATATNFGYEPLSLTGPTGCLIYFQVQPAAGGISVYNSSDGCTGVTVTEEIASGAQKTQVFVWEGLGSNGVRLGSGQYILRGNVRVTGNTYLGPALAFRIE